MIYVFLANGFEEVEALTPVDVLRRAGCEVKTVGVGGKEITGSHKICVKADMEVTDIEIDKAEMVVLPGGIPGTPNLEQSDAVRAAVEQAAKNGAWVAAICAAPSILGHLGLLKGRRATSYPSFEKELIGAEVTHAPVEVDGTFITGRGAGAALPFALKLAEVLKGAEKARQTGVAMCVPGM